MVQNESSFRDRQELFRMLRELIRILDLLIYERAARIPEELEEPLRVAWTDFHERHSNRIFNALETAPALDSELSESDRERGRMSLEGVGLTGAHLEVKSRGFWGGK